MPFKAIATPTSERFLNHIHLHSPGTQLSTQFSLETPTSASAAHHSRVTGFWVYTVFLVFHPVSLSPHALNLERELTEDNTPGTKDL